MNKLDFAIAYGAGWDMLNKLLKEEFEMSSDSTLDILHSLIGDIQNINASLLQGQYGTAGTLIGNFQRNMRFMFERHAGNDRNQNLLQAYKHSTRMLNSVKSKGVTIHSISEFCEEIRLIKVYLKRAIEVFTPKVQDFQVTGHMRCKNCQHPSLIPISIHAEDLHAGMKYLQEWAEKNGYALLDDAAVKTPIETS